jgi:Flp pilus assembly protein TadG
MQKLIRRPARRGLAVIEAAIFFPLLFLLLFGMIEYGWAFLKFQCITNAAREGARAAALQGATDASWQAAVASVMTGCGKSGTTPPFTRTLSPAVSSAPGTQLTCTVVVNYTDINLLNVSLFPNPPTLTGKATLVKEGPL